MNKTARMVAAILLLTAFGIMLGGCVTAGGGVSSSQSRERGPSLGSFEGPQASGTIVVRLTPLANPSLWSDLSAIDRYYQISDYYSFNTQDDRSIPHGKYRPPYIPDRHASFDRADFYRPVEISDDAEQQTERVLAYLERYRSYTPGEGEPGNDVVRSLNTRPPMAIVTVRRTDSRDTLGIVNVYYPTERGVPVETDEDYAFLVENEPDAIVWLPSEPEQNVSAAPGRYEVSIRLLTYRVGNIARVEDEDGRVKILSLLFQGAFSKTDDFMTVVFSDRTTTVDLGPGESLYVQMSDFRSPLEVVDESE